MKLEPVSKNVWKISAHNGMVVEPYLYASDIIKDAVEDDALGQLRDAASLPGVVYAAAMPDIHVGYGVPVGCVMASDWENGLVSAGAVGMDINCGMRMLGSGLQADELDRSQIKVLARSISKVIPLGIGTESRHAKELSRHRMEILNDGLKALHRLGYARKDDRNRVQDGGCYPGASAEYLSERARERLKQLSTLGGGNHFIEIDEVTEVHDDPAARTYGLEKGSLVVIIHTGSRGLGHQICNDFSNRMKSKASQYGLEFPNQGLASAPIHSEDGQQYLASMAAAANHAYSNRQMIAYDIRKVFENVLDLDADSCLPTVYDITHNLARRETVQDRDVLVHRKGAVRALPAGHPDNPDVYRDVGHPVIVPGNMGTGGYLLGAIERTVETYYSVNHGAGRTMSRTAAKKRFSEEGLLDELGDIILLGAKRTKILDEAPGAYKSLEEVVSSLTDVNLARKIVRFRPKAVIKGD